MSGDGDQLQDAGAGASSEGPGGVAAPPGGVLQPLPLDVSEHLSAEPSPDGTHTSALVVPHVMPVEDSPAPVPEPPLPMLPAIFAGWIRPARTARRTRHLPLFSAYVGHWLGVILTWLVMAVTTGITVVFTAGDQTFGDATADFFARPLQEIIREPIALLAVATGVAMMELAFVLAGLLLAPWGAVDEPMTGTLCNSLRQVWLHTSDAVPAILLVSLLFIPIDNAQRHYWEESRRLFSESDWTDRPEPPVYPLNATPADVAAFQQAQADYEQAMGAYYQKERERYREMQARRTFLVKFGPAIGAGASLLAGIYVLWLWLRAIGVRRDAPPIPRQPGCESCGYALVGLPWQGRCPECGESVAESMRGTRARGSPWQHRRDIGRLRAYLHTAGQFIFQPRKLGRALIATRVCTDHRPFLAMHLLLVFLIGAAAPVAIAYAIGENLLNLAEELWEGAEIMVIFGATMMGVGLLAAMGSAALVSAFRWFERKRNFSAVAMQAAAYGSPMLVLVAMASAGVVFPLLRYWEWVEVLAGQLQMEVGFTFLLAWLAVTLGGLFLYFMRVWRATAGARYANR